MRLVAAHVVAARAMLKMTQDELAAAAGITQKSLSLFESGITMPRASTLNRIQKALEYRGISFANGDRPTVTLDREKAIIPT